ncbi:recombinase family protein [bacterium]|nr:recombinase family protein [bacterium]
MSKYFLYARKSTESEDRQIMSIEQQFTEVKEYAKKEGLNIISEFTESMTAKKPGRPVFNELLARLEKGEADGILAWNPDRLARNSIDGGRIIYLVDTGVIKSLKFPTFRFDNNAYGKFILSIAFGQSKYYTDSLSENIRRGIRHKLRKGIWPGWAPLGYLNDHKTKTIVIDKEKAPLIEEKIEIKQKLNSFA